MESSATKPSSRGPGRPPNDGIDQRERLLDAALASFSELGIAGTSLRSLARQGGVTPAMLNYYFGTKQRLIEAIVDERLLPIILCQHHAVLAADTVSASDLVAGFVRNLYAAIGANRWLPALWVREVLADGGQLRDVFVQRIGPKLAIPLVKRLSAAQTRGEIDPQVDPRLLFVSLIGLIMVPFAAEPIWRNVFDADDIDSDRMLEHTLALATHGLGK